MVVVVPKVVEVEPVVVVVLSKYYSMCGAAVPVNTFVVGAGRIRIHPSNTYPRLTIVTLLSFSLSLMLDQHHLPRIKWRPKLRVRQELALPVAWRPGVPEERRPPVD